MCTHNEEGDVEEILDQCLKKTQECIKRVLTLDRESCCDKLGHEPAPLMECLSVVIAANVLSIDEDAGNCCATSELLQRSLHISSISCSRIQ